MDLYYNNREDLSPAATGAPGPAVTVAPSPAGSGALSSAVRVRRHPERASYDREVIDAILDEGLVAHVGLASAGQPFVMPMLYARLGDSVYLHGSPKSRLVSAVAEGATIGFTVTLLDGLVLARSAFRHSLNYRSVVVLGPGRPVRELEEKQTALRTLVDHVMPGRSDQVRGPSDPELKVTEVVALDLRDASAKARTGPPVDNADDYSLPVWAGVLPLHLGVGAPIPDQRCELTEPPELALYRRGHA